MVRNPASLLMRHERKNISGLSRLASGSKERASGYRQEFFRKLRRSRNMAGLRASLSDI